MSTNISPETRYQCVWGEISAKVVARQNAQSVSVIAVATVMALVLRQLNNVEDAGFVEVSLAVLPSFVALIFMMWFCALDLGIALLSQMCRIYDTRDDKDDTEKNPKWFAKEQGWLSKANNFRLYPGLGQLGLSLSTALPPIILYLETDAWLSLVLAGALVVAATSMLISAWRYRVKHVQYLRWYGKIPDGAD